MEKWFYSVVFGGHINCSLPTKKKKERENDQLYFIFKDLEEAGRVLFPTLSFNSNFTLQSVHFLGVSFICQLPVLSPPLLKLFLILWPLESHAKVIRQDLNFLGYFLALERYVFILTFNTLTALISRKCLF